MTLFSPLALIGLVALGLPLLIHLLRRPERQVIEFAALRWLREQPLPRREWRWHERVLLLLRLALIAAAVLLLAQPAWRHAEAPVPGWVVVAPGMNLAAVRVVIEASSRTAPTTASSPIAPAIDSPVAAWRWLAPGFPVIGSQPPADAASAPASLIRQLDAELPDGTPLTLVVPAEMAGLDAERLRLHRPVNWRIVPAVSSSSSASRPAGLSGASRLRVAIRADAQGRAERAVANALLAAWQADTSSGWTLVADEAPVADLAAPVPVDTDLLFWLGGSEPGAAAGAWVAGGGTALLTRRGCPDATPVLRDAVGEPLLSMQPRGRGRLLCLPTALTPSATPAVRDADFPRRLFDALTAGTDRPVPERAFASAVEPSLVDGSALAGANLRPLDPVWALMVAALFAAERWWATRRRRSTEARRAPPS